MRFSKCPRLPLDSFGVDQMYTGQYSLGSRCFSEFIATALMIFLGLGTLGNELLAKTKGHGMGCVSSNAMAQ